MTYTFLHRTLFWLLFIGVMPFSIAQEISLNGKWAFKTDPYGKGESEGWYTKDLNDTGWESMEVPGNWDLHNEYAHYTGKAWYRKTVTVPADWKDKAVRLLFEAVYHNSKVWVNGALVGESNSGFLPFEFEVSKSLRPGEKNTIVVCADNTYRRGAIWNWGGIRRPVTLVAHEEARVVSQFISPEVNLSQKTARVAVRVLMENYQLQPLSLRGEVVFTTPEGFSKMLPFETTLKGKGQSEVVVETQLSKDQVHLWHFDDPFLYTSVVKIYSGNQVLDQHIDRFGLRKVEVNKEAFTFRLNGEPVRLMGFNLVPDDRTTGNTLPLWRVKEDVDMMKALGGNFGRISHLPLPKEALDYLDEKGILVFAEVPLWGFDSLVDTHNPIPKDWLRQLIALDYNHPSIIGWSVGNEIGHNADAMEYVRTATELARRLDTTRMAVMVSHTAERPVDPISYSDMGLVNGYGIGIGGRADRIHALYPDKLLFYTEYGYNQFTEDLDGDLNMKGMVDSIRFKPYLMGGSIWTFNDYRSAYPGTKEFSENRAWGIVDVFRQKKQAYFSLRKEYAPIRELKVTEVIMGEKASATVSITPRLPLDLPAYPLHDYKLAWTVVNDQGDLIGGGFSELPLIQPGGAVLTQKLSWTQDGAPFSMKVEVLSPQLYAMYDTTLYFQVPLQPQIIYAVGGRMQLNDRSTNKGNIRVAFEQDENCTGYKAVYGKGALDQETPVTRKHYLDINGLAFGETYQVAIVGINGKGESVRTDVQSVRVGDKAAPPAILYTEPADGGFFIGYPTSEEDYVFIVQYTTVSGNYAQAKSIQSNTPGVMFVPGLENGTRYYFRMRRLMDNSSISTWSEELSITPDGGQLPQAPEVKGVLRQPTQALVNFSPVKKSTGYQVQYREKPNGEWKSQVITSAEISYVLIPNLPKNKPCQFRMATINANGQSAFSDILVK